MIKIYTNREQYQYDLHALFKAFYPEQEVRVYGLCGQGEREDGEARAVLIFDDSKIEAVFDIDGEKEYTNIYKNDTCVTKNEHKLSVYHDLCDYTGHTLPWGNLTGIRPTKLSMGMLAEGKDDDAIIAQMKEEHAVSDEKARLSLDIAKREKRILDKIHYEDGYSLYIGIPFCPTTCLYCSFTSYPIAQWKKRVNDYLDALFREIDFVAQVYQDKVLDTVYIGGGTPTTLEADALDRLLSRMRERFDFQHVTEFTVEAGRADSITRDKLDVLKKHGVTRISVNPQTMKDETLKIIGRQHTVAQVREAFALARAAGFDNINMDLISGLPEENHKDMEHTMQEIAALKPDSVTVHALAIKRASRLNELWEEYKGSMGVLQEETAQMMEQYAREMGLLPYYLYRQKNMAGNLENVGYAAPGKAGIYNILIMEEKQTIVACGAGSISKRVYSDGRIERCENVKDVTSYIERIGEMIERKRVLLED